jgi:uncharacterized protein YbjT (DUF2867 family)
VYIQPIASDDVALAVADLSLGAPVNGVVEVAGPDKVRLTDLIQRFLAGTNDPRKVVADTGARYFGALLKDDTLVPDAGARLGAVTLDDWFCRSHAAAH